MADFRAAFEYAFSNNQPDWTVFTNNDPIGIIEYFDGPFMDILTPLLSIYSGPLGSELFINSIINNYGPEAESGWKLILNPFLLDISNALFIPRTTANPITPGMGIISGSASNIYTAILALTSNMQFSSAFTNALFQGIFFDILLAGSGNILQPVILAPYIPV